MGVINTPIHFPEALRLGANFKGFAAIFNLFEIVTKNIANMHRAYILKAKKFAGPPFQSKKLRKKCVTPGVIFGQICGKFKFFCGIVGVAILAFRMYGIVSTIFHLFQTPSKTSRPMFYSKPRLKTPGRLDSMFDEMMIIIDILEPSAFQT